MPQSVRKRYEGMLEQNLGEERSKGMIENFTVRQRIRMRRSEGIGRSTHRYSDIIGEEELCFAAFTN